MKSPKPPKPTPPERTGAAQEQASATEQKFNLISGSGTKTSPFGQETQELVRTETITDQQGNPIEVPVYNTTQTLSAPEQAKYQAETDVSLQGLGIAGQQLGRVEEALANPLDYGSLPEMSTDTSQYAAALRSKLDPIQQQRRAALGSQLANQGITAGSEAWNREMQAIGDQESRADIDALLSAQQYGTNALNDAIAARQQRIQEEAFKQQLPVNQAIGFLSGTQVNAPQFTQRPQSNFQGPNMANVYGNYDNNRLQAWQAQQAQAGAGLGGLFSLGGSLMGLFSSPHMKQHITEPAEFLERVNKLKVKTWQYNRAAQVGFNLDDDYHVGPMADDWRDHFGGNGRTIHVGDAIGVLIKSVQELTTQVEDLQKEVKRLKNGGNV